MMDGTTELRHLPPSERRHLVQLLDCDDSWRILASYIPKPASASGIGPYLITSNHMRILDELRHRPAQSASSCSPSDALVEFWATCGKKGERPTLLSLIEILLRCKLTRIAVYIASLIGLSFNDFEDTHTNAPSSGGESGIPDLNTSSVNSVFHPSSSALASPSLEVSPPLVPLPSATDSNHHRPNLPWSDEHSLNLIQLTLGKDEDTRDTNAASTFNSNFTSNFNDLLAHGTTCPDGNAIDHQRTRADPLAPGALFDQTSLPSTVKGQTASVNQSSSSHLSCIGSKLNKLGLDVSTLDTAIIPYTKLHQLTNDFAPVAIGSGGHMIGAGAYGTVFKVTLTQHELHWHNLMLNHEKCSTGACSGHSGKQKSLQDQVSPGKTTVSASLASSNLSTELAKSPVTVAVKVLAEDVDTKQFINEVTVLTKFKHENLLPFLGISIDGPRLCLLYQFMPLGSLTRALERNREQKDISICPDVPGSNLNSAGNLTVDYNNPLSGNKLTSPGDANLGNVSSGEDKLPVNDDRENVFKIGQNHQLNLEKEKNQQAKSHPHHLSPNLLPSVCDRVRIALGTAKGLTYLHTFDVVSYVHRDVKSDNILLGYNFTPKLGDFGLTRIGSTASSTSSSTTSSATSTKTSLVTQNVIGTTVYMAPEAFRGDISTKLDSFAYGIVLLELLTGLPAFDSSREEVDILSYVEDALEDWDFESEATVQTTGQKSLEAIKKLLDERIDWNSEQKLNLAIGLFRISKLATEQRKKNRLSMVKVLQELQKLIQFTGIQVNIQD